MRNGKLNKREIETIRKAAEILNAWIDYNDENDGRGLAGFDFDTADYVDSIARNAAGACNIVAYYLEDC